jgi:hypothetical protein
LKKSADGPALFCCGFVIAKRYRDFEPACYIGGMALDQTSMICRRVVIDDRCRLPGRFFGRFATSATSELTRAA